MTRLGICSVFKNEAANLEEWVLFHQAQGFTRFYLFDDKSTDNSLAVLEPFVRSGAVTVGTTNDLPLFTEGRQPAAFNIGLKQARGESDWVAFIDTDEFLFSPNGRVVDHLPKNPFVAGVAIWWRIFGSSGNEAPPSVGVIRGYTRSARFPATLSEAAEIFQFQNHDFFDERGRVISGNVLQVKSIVRPRMIREYHVHQPTKYFGALVDENGNTFHRGRHLPTHSKLRINHYWSKSLSELAEKEQMFARDAAFLNDYVSWDEVLNREEDTVILDHLSWQQAGVSQDKNDD
jgi:glycosyltransferase involved in cell wall biosynthesis